MFANMPTAIDYARDGRLRALAVTGAQRAPAAPDLPTVAEAACRATRSPTWYGVSAPAKTPRAIVDRLHDEIEPRAQFAGPAAPGSLRRAPIPIGTTPEQYTAFVRSEIVKWGKVIKAAGIKGDQP